MFFFKLPGTGYDSEPGIYAVPEPVPSTVDPPKRTVGIVAASVMTPPTCNSNWARILLGKGKVTILTSMLVQMLQCDVLQYVHYTV